ncbi:MAG: hypothetical protein IKP32_10145 [Clostridia bacterium]|nr:hypothetical protein [Clostridia bacterium]
MRDILGRPVREALSSLPADAPRPRVVETSAPVRHAPDKREGTLRVVACRDGVWIAARFLDRPPREKEGQ